jgi:hypothetical protein
LARIKQGPLGRVKRDSSLTLRQRELRASDLPLSVAFPEQDILGVQGFKQVLKPLHNTWQAARTAGLRTVAIIA